jgi:hypothetical protein
MARRAVNGKRLVREKPEPLAVPQHSNQVWSMDFMHDQLEDGRSFRLLNGELRAHAQWPWHAGRHRTA